MYNSPCNAQRGLPESWLRDADRYVSADGVRGAAIWPPSAASGPFNRLRCAVHCNRKAPGYLNDPITRSQGYSHILD